MTFKQKRLDLWWKEIQGSLQISEKEKDMKQTVFWKANYVSLFKMEGKKGEPVVLASIQYMFD